MELIEGETLADRIQRGPLPLDEIVRIADEATEALAMAHEMGFVHRDIKPSNLMLTRQGHVKVLDFGVAKRVPPPAPTRIAERTLSEVLTTPGQVVGTVSYMAPEQLRGEPADPRSDIFSFGVVLYQMLTGRHPFRRPSPFETASAILSEAPPAVRDLRHDVSAGVFGAAGAGPGEAGRSALPDLRGAASARSRAARDPAHQPSRGPNR